VNAADIGDQACLDLAVSRPAGRLAVNERPPADGRLAGLPAAGLPELQAAASSATAPSAATVLVAGVTVPPKDAPCGCPQGRPVRVAAALRPVTLGAAARRLRNRRPD
jgi:hypothetical protein